MSRTKGIDPGRLNHRITIKRYVESEDELGNTINTLEPLKRVWAEVRPLRGKESLEYYKDVHDQIYKITIRYTDVTTTDVVVFNGVQYRIQWITDPLMDHNYLELMCTRLEEHAVLEEEG